LLPRSSSLALFSLLSLPLFLDIPARGGASTALQRSEAVALAMAVEAATDSHWNRAGYAGGVTSVTDSIASFGTTAPARQHCPLDIQGENM